MKRGLWIAYVAALHLLLGLLVAQSRTVGLLLRGHTPEIERAHSVLRQRDAAVPPGFAVFLGDSLTQRLPVGAVTHDAVNLGIGSLTTHDLARHLPRYQSVQTARVVYLHIGTNDEGEPDFGSVLANLPDVPLVWTEVFGNESANRMIRAMCAARPNCVTVPLELEPGDLLPDGTHLTASGTRKWIAALRRSNLVGPGDPDIP